MQSQGSAKGPLGNAVHAVEWRGLTLMCAAVVRGGPPKAHSPPALQLKAIKEAEGRGVLCRILTGNGASGGSGRKKRQRACRWEGVPTGDVLEERGGLSGTQKFVHQKWPNQIFALVNFVFPHCGHYGLEGGGGRPGRGVSPPPPAVYGHSNTSLVPTGALLFSEPPPQECIRRGGGGGGGGAGTPLLPGSPYGPRRRRAENF